VEGLLGNRLHESESCTSARGRDAELIPRLSRDAELIPRLSRAAELIPRLSRDAELIPRLSRDAELIPRLSRDAELIPRLSRAAELIPRLSRAAAASEHRHECKTLQSRGTTQPSSPYKQTDRQTDQHGTYTATMRALTPVILCYHVKGKHAISTAGIAFHKLLSKADPDQW